MKTIIYLEDEPIILQQCTAALEKNFSGFRILTANHGTQGLDLIRREKPEIVITDFSLPGHDGATILDSLAKNNPDVSVVLTSGYTLILRDIDRRRWPFRFLHCLGKPFEIRDFVRVVDHAVQSCPTCILHDANPLNVLQLIHWEKKPCRLKIVNRHGTGQLLFDTEGLVFASFNQLSGLEAVKWFVKSPQNQARLFYGPLPARESNMTLPFGELMLLLCQYLDEVDQPELATL